MQSSLSSPLAIAAVAAPGVSGRVGLTLCPGKKDRDGGWDRDLKIDVGQYLVRAAQLAGILFVDSLNLDHKQRF